VITAVVSFRHLRHLTDGGGLYEHAEGTRPRREHGYCVDDVARGLVVACREPDQGDLRELYLDFVLTACDSKGRIRNRRNTMLQWTDEPSLEDRWGRGLWGLGAAVACPEDVPRRNEAVRAFERGAGLRSPHSRAMVFAGLGAALVLTQRPDNVIARSLLSDVARQIGPPSRDPDWVWPQPRLTYANAAVAEVLLAAGDHLHRQSLVNDGLRMLGWLLDIETRDGHLSVTPVGGRGPGEVGPGFDQQPIEVAALADACARAFTLTAEARWSAGVQLAAAWFHGANDSGCPLADDVSGGGCDGLEALGRNDNQGAESTLALISTMQQLSRLTTCPA
jgi:hypothetical protein